MMLPITIAIPTYRREAMLVQTITHLLVLPEPAAEIIVLDQTEQHEPQTDAALHELNAEGRIRWIRLPEPSIPHAMNQGLLLASESVVLFVDDDVRPEPDLLAAHLQAHSQFPGDGLVAGRVVQPWQEEAERTGDQLTGLAARVAAEVEEFIGCNFSVGRDLALSLGGFDQNFVRVAYRFEAEFAHRYRAGSRRIHFEPRACLHHLKDAAGGTRTFGEHLTTWRPDHAVGAYYFGLCTGSWREFAARPWRAIATRYHLRNPWRIPLTVFAELGGMGWALILYLRGPRRLQVAPRNLA